MPTGAFRDNPDRGAVHPGGDRETCTPRGRAWARVGVDRGDDGFLNGNTVERDIHECRGPQGNSPVPGETEYRMRVILAKCGCVSHPGFEFRPLAESSP